MWKPQKVSVVSPKTVRICCIAVEGGSFIQVVPLQSIEGRFIFGRSNQSKTLLQGTPSPEAPPLLTSISTVVRNPIVASPTALGWDFRPTKPREDCVTVQYSNSIAPLTIFPLTRPQHERFHAEASATGRCASCRCSIDHSSAELLQVLSPIQPN